MFFGSEPSLPLRPRHVSTKAGQKADLHAARCYGSLSSITVSWRRSGSGSNRSIHREHSQLLASRRPSSKFSQRFVLLHVHGSSNVHQMDLDTQSLKECRLGPIVLFYTKTKRVTPPINRSADSLVQAWSRPIIKRPANFRNRHVERQELVGEDMQVDVEARKQVRKRFNTAEAIKENEGRKGARLYLSKVSSCAVLRWDEADIGL